MRYVAAYLLAVLGGNASPSESDVNKILSSVGIDVDDGNVKKIIGELKGKNLEELMAEGRKKLSSMPAAGPAPAASVGTPAAGAPAKEAEKQKEAPKPKEEEPEEDEDMGFGLFD